MDIKTILLLDGTDPGVIPRITRLLRDKKVVVITERNLRNEDPYAAPPDFLERLRIFAALDRLLDLVIIGHNEDAGLEKAAVIHEKHRPRTVIVSDGNLRADTRQKYERLGFRQFMTRRELSRQLDAILRR
jgi:hypothetical protein